MRITVTIPDELVEQARRETGKDQVGEAITDSLTAYFRLKSRLALLDDLFDQPVPHAMRNLRQGRRKRN